jgi:hypothetical protein
VCIFKKYANQFTGEIFTDSSHLFFFALVSSGYHGKGKTFVCSKMDAFRQIGIALRKRILIQKRRKVFSKYLQKIFDNRYLIHHRTKGD